MPGENIQDWSVTATNNGSADTSINFAEGQPRASVNNSARSMMAAHAKNRNLQNGSIVTGGTADAQTFTSGVTYTTVPTGLRVLLKIGTGLTNTTAATLNMDGIGSVAILDWHNAALNGGEIVGDTYAEFLYNGTNWILLGSSITMDNIDDAIEAASAARSFFVAHASSDQVGFAVGLGSIVNFSAEEFDVGSKYDGVSSWTPLAGRISISGTVKTTSNSSFSTSTLTIIKNSVSSGKTVGCFYDNAGTGDISFSFYDIATGTDVYQLQMVFSAGGTVFANSWWQGAQL